MTKRTDLKIDTQRENGKGGQGLNKRDDGSAFWSSTSPSSTFGSCSSSASTRSQQIMNDEIRQHMHYIPPTPGYSTITETSFLAGNVRPDNHHIFCKSPAKRPPPSPRIWEGGKAFVSSPFRKSGDDDLKKLFYTSEYTASFTDPATKMKVRSGPLSPAAMKSAAA